MEESRKKNKVIMESIYCIDEEENQILKEKFEIEKQNI